MIRSLSFSLFITFGFLLALGACSNEPDRKVREFVKKTKSSQIVNVETLPHFATIEPYKYTAFISRSPFEAANTEAKKPPKIKPSGPSPDMQRPKELLESYPLDSLKMVGTLSRRGKIWVLIKDSRGFVHRVGEGNYLGENFGKIEKINEKSIEVHEWVSDGEGSFRQRTVQLKLSE